MEVLGEIVYYLCRLGPQPEALLFLKMDRGKHVNQLMICVQRQDILGIQPSGALSRQRARCLDDSAAVCSASAGTGAMPVVTLSAATEPSGERNPVPIIFIHAFQD